MQAGKETGLKFELPSLPYAKDALEPHLSARTVHVHYEKHHRGYLAKLRQAIEDKPEADRELEEIIRSSDRGVFNLAAQVWNHGFYWNSLRPHGGGRPDGELLSKIQRSFGSFDDFKRAFAEAANGQFGSGWAWLLLDAHGRLRVRSTPDAENPLGSGQRPLLTIDVWEHAYYLDYQNERAKYVEGVIDHLLDWDFAQRRMAGLDAS